MSVLHSVVAVFAAFFSLVGVLWALWGSLLVTKSQHPFTTEALWDFVINEAPIAAMGLLRQPSDRGKKEKAAIKKVANYVDLADTNPLDKRSGLVGISLIFIGFLFQSAGCFLWVIDALWSGLSQNVK